MCTCVYTQTYILHKGLYPEYIKNSKPIGKRQSGLLFAFFF